MKKIIYLFAFGLIIGCSSSDDDTPILGITELTATGSVADQSVAEAKSTIYGKWDISSSAKSSSNAKSYACSFDFIEFTDDAYIMSLFVEGEKITVFGSYDMNENSSGNVSSVDLNFAVGSSEVTIATLTDIVVVENGDNLSASFTVDLNIPDEADFDACNSLDGDYSAAKDEPMDESDSATADTNHAKIVKSWRLISVVIDGQNFTSELLMEPCIGDYNPETDEDEMIEGCTPASSLTVTFSTFGTYSFVLLGSNEGTMVETDNWNWTSTDQNAFYVGEGEDLGVISIVSLTDSSLEVTDDEGTFYTFSAQ